MGEQVYAQAGGTTTRDLFSSDEEAFADDVQLVRSLAEIRLCELAEVERAEGWGAVNASLERPENYYALPTLYPDAERELSDEEQASLDTIARQIAALEEEGVPYYDTCMRDLEIERHRIEDERRFHSDVQKAVATLYLFVGYHGLERHAVGKPQSKRASGEDAAPKPDYPAALISDLGAIRTFAVREAVAKRPDLALDFLLDQMLGQLVGGAYTYEQALELRIGETAAEPKPELIENSPVEAIETLVSDLLPQMQGDDRLEAIEALSDDDKLRWLAFCVASQITAKELTGTKGEAIGAVASKAGVDMQQLWSPNAAFFTRLTKPVMLKLLGEHCGEEAVLNCKRLKKADLAEVCANRLGQAGYYPPMLQPVDDTPPWDVESDMSENAIAA